MNPIATLSNVWSSILDGIKWVGQNINDIKVGDFSGWQLFSIGMFSFILGVIIFKIVKFW